MKVGKIIDCKKHPGKHNVWPRRPQPFFADKLLRPAFLLQTRLYKPVIRRWCFILGTNWLRRGQTSNCYFWSCQACAAWRDAKPNGRHFVQLETSKNERNRFRGDGHVRFYAREGWNSSASCRSCPWRSCSRPWFWRSVNYQPLSVKLTISCPFNSLAQRGLVDRSLKRKAKLRATIQNISASLRLATFSET